METNTEKTTKQAVSNESVAKVIKQLEQMIDILKKDPSKFRVGVSIITTEYDNRLQVSGFVLGSSVDVVRAFSIIAKEHPSEFLMASLDLLNKHD